MCRACVWKPLSSSKGSLTAPPRPPGPLAPEPSRRRAAPPFTPPRVRGDRQARAPDQGGEAHRAQGPAGGRAAAGRTPSRPAPHRHPARRARRMASPHRGRRPHQGCRGGGSGGPGGQPLRAGAVRPRPRQGRIARTDQQHQAPPRRDGLQRPARCAPRPGCREGAGRSPRSRAAGQRARAVGSGVRSGSVTRNRAGKRRGAFARA